MEDFDFPFFTIETNNPESSTRAQLGNSYVFVAPPTDPDQRTFVLYYPTMKFYTDANGLLTDTIYPQYNMLAFIKFYAAHKLHKSFRFNHPVHGLMQVKFNKPFTEPKGLPNGTGAVEAFSVELIEIV